MRPRLTLVGAGPGDPELITLKGLRALQTAGAVLYDALVHPALLDHAPASAERLFVGKRRGRCEFAQEDLNHLIVEYAQRYGHVVRLKGGDPFVFGRGFEELTFAREFGIETAVVPGISSSYAVPALAGIPLTSRGLSESFWVLTGTTRFHQLSGDIHAAVRSNATLVILMGMQHLDRIMRLLCGAGKEDLPVAIIQNGSCANERVLFGLAGTIAEEAVLEGFSNPAVIVAGEVVSLNKEFFTQTNKVAVDQLLDSLGVGGRPGIA
ncbi:uroporphyrinogen-III C-methyltransferase [Tellurirhabdus rosea]|uniref:uroporphyrinogen-III C-methyltransferase n=1 Tax=Tellurirhabdus rosea TaxID=2674997 RepID=UPI002257444E|nr:uroporphyrinogen-III C-methyltransferase [Tellurirhabdus rosea]